MLRFLVATRSGDAPRQVFYQIFDSSITVSPHNGQPEAKLLDASVAEGAAIQGLGRATAAA